MLPEIFLAIRREFSPEVWKDIPGADPGFIREKCAAIEAGPLPLPVKCAEIIAFILRSAPVCVNPYDMFADRIRHDDILSRMRSKRLGDALRDRPFARGEEYRAAYDSGLCQGTEDFGHCSPDWDRILTLGLRGMADECRSKAESARLTEKQKSVYESCVIACGAMEDFALRLADEYGKTPDIPASWFASDNLRAIAVRRPRTLGEALQLMTLYYFIQSYLEGSIIRSLGPLDRLLYPFYLADREAGIAGDEECREMLRHFIGRIDAAGITANAALCLTGLTGDGKANPLSMLILGIQEELAGSDIKYHIRCSKNTPKLFIRRIMEMIRAGNSSFVFCSDDVVIRALTGIGIAAEDAERYVMIGCYEASAMGTEIPCTCSGMVSLPKAVELALNNGADMRTGRRIGPATGEPDSLDSFDKLLEAMKKQLVYACALAEERISHIETLYPAVHASPLFTAAMPDCVERGRDAYDSGAKYNNSSVVTVSIATAVDSLQVLRHFVYGTGRISLSGFAEILKNNWEGSEKLRSECRRYTEKYGNHVAEADALAQELLSCCAAQVNGRPNGRGGVFRMGCFSIDWRYRYGEKTTATADGRFAGEPLSKNLTPSTGQDRQGVTAMLLSASAVDAAMLPDGCVVDLMLHPTTVQGESGAAVMEALLGTYFGGGGFALHCNVLDAETMKKAQKDPADHANLQVRLCGWNVRFVNLSRAEQDFLIRQAEGRVE